MFCCKYFKTFTKQLAQIARPSSSTYLLGQVNYYLNYRTSFHKRQPSSSLFTNCAFIRGKHTLRHEPTKLDKKFNMEWPKITLFGDSITRQSMDPDNGCWASHLGNAVGKYFDVDVRGFDGYNSKWGLELAPKLFPKSYLDKVELFVLWFGHNDSWCEGVPISVPLSQYNTNMRAIIKYLNDNGLDSGKIIMITPTWYHDEAFKKFLSGDPLGLEVSKTLESATKYAETVMQIAKDNNIDVIDFFSISAKHEPLEEMFCDGVHFSRIGAKMLFDQVIPVVQRKIEAKYKKPLVDLVHSWSYDQHPEFVAAIKKMKQTKA